MSLGVQNGLTAGDYNVTSGTINWPYDNNYWIPNVPVPTTTYYPWYITVPDAALAERVSGLEKENAELRGKVDTLEKMLAALIGGTK